MTRAHAQRSITRKRGLATVSHLHLWLFSLSCFPARLGAAIAGTHAGTFGFRALSSPSRARAPGQRPSGGAGAGAKWLLSWSLLSLCSSRGNAALWREKALASSLAGARAAAAGREGRCQRARRLARLFDFSLLGAGFAWPRALPPRLGGLRGELAGARPWPPPGGRARPLRGPALARARWQSPGPL